MSDMFYVLMEAGWDYNDEVMFRPECGGGHPASVFAEEDAAQTECNARNVKSFKELFLSGEIRNYSYGMSDLIPYSKKKDDAHRAKLDAVCTKMFGVDWERLTEIVDEHSYARYDDRDKLEKPIVKEGVTDADWLEFLNCTKLEFWEVITVEKG